MALGNGGKRSADSMVLTITSGVAIAIVFLLVILLIILRARYRATRSREARRERRLEEEFEKQLASRVLHKPTLYEVWLSRTDPARLERLERSGRSEGHNSNGTQSNHLDCTLPGNDKALEWEEIMPLLAVETEDLTVQEKNSNPISYSIGVFVQLPQARPTSWTNLASREKESVGAAGGTASTANTANIQDSNIVFGLNNSFVNRRPP